jgi:hypothetical protein
VTTSAGCASTVALAYQRSSAHQAPGDGLIAGDGGPQVAGPVVDLQRDAEVEFAGPGLHGVCQPEIEKTFAGGVHDELAGLIAEGLLGGADHHELAASSRPPGGEPLFVIDEAVPGWAMLGVKQLPAAKAKASWCRLRSPRPDPCSGVEGFA